MKKTLYIISLLILTNTITSPSETVYSFVGKTALAHLEATGECKKCDLSGQDLRHAINHITTKQSLWSKSPQIDLSYLNLTHAIITDDVKTTGAVITGTTVLMSYKTWVTAFWTP